MASTYYGSSSFFVLGASHDGVVYVARLEADDSCHHMTALKLQNSEGEDGFGSAVALGSNGIVWVGAPGYDRWTNPCPGADCVDGLVFARAYCWAAAQTRTLCQDTCLAPPQRHYECDPALSATALCDVPTRCLGGGEGLVLAGPMGVACGNGRKERYEECDDGKDPPASGDGCSDICTIELGMPVYQEVSLIRVDRLCRTMYALGP